jgi:hypothetical protein
MSPSGPISKSSWLSRLPRGLSTAIYTFFD